MLFFTLGVLSNKDKQTGEMTVPKVVDGFQDSEGSLPVRESPIEPYPLSKLPSD